MSLALCLLISILYLTSATAQEPNNPVSLAAPSGGWSVAQPINNFVQNVTYPASQVNVREDMQAQIRGTIANQSKGKPALLVVNGVSMPLEVNESGQFARPYSFAKGSNSIEVRRTGDAQGRRVQFYDAAEGGVRAKLRVVLNWDSPNTDMDLHVISPSGQHCYYGNRIIENGGALDVDVTTGFGPEIFATSRPERGMWHVYVNYFGGGRGGLVSTVQVAVITNEGSTSETRRTYRLPLRANGEIKHVASFSVL